MKRTMVFLLLLMFLFSLSSEASDSRKRRRRGGSSEIIMTATKRKHPNDFWANNTFRLNKLADNDGTPLSDGIWDNNGFIKLEKTWAVPWIYDDQLDLERAWGITTGDTNIVVAMIDVEIDYTHYDLVDNVSTNWIEKDGIPGIDDDGNGLIDDIHGWDFKDWTNDPRPPFDDLDEMGLWMSGNVTQHGTQMMGLLAGKGNNESWDGRPNFTDKRAGSCGWLWDARVLPIQSFTNYGYTHHSTHKYRLSSWYGQSVDYLIHLKDTGQMDIRVLSMSWTGQKRYLISRCIEAGILPVTGAGNTGIDVVQSGCASDSILCMGGVGATGLKMDGSETANYGPTIKLSGIIAPGGGSGYFHYGDWSNPNPDDMGWYSLIEGYTSKPSYFVPGWSSTRSTGIIGANVDWGDNFNDPANYPDWMPLEGIIGTPGLTSGATTQGAGIAMLLFSVYPEVGPLQCLAMLERGASTSIYDGRNDSYCEGNCDGNLGAGKINAYRSITLWGAVADTVLSGTIYVSGDVHLGSNVEIADGTIFEIAPEDIYRNEIELPEWLDCQEQYRIPAVSHAPTDLYETTEIYIAGNVLTGNNITFRSYANVIGSNDWGGIWVQSTGSIDDRNITIENTIRGDFQ